MRTTIQLILALITMAVLIWVVWQGFTLLHERQLVLDASTQAIVVMVAIVAITCTFMLTAALRGHAESIARGQVLQIKSLHYESYVLAWRGVQQDSYPEDMAKLRAEMEEIKSRIALHGSREVIQLLNRLSELSAKNDFKSTEAQQAYGSLILAMRSDLGSAASIAVKMDLGKLIAL